MRTKFIFYFILCQCSDVFSLPDPFQTEKFKVGIEYDHSLPMSGGSDRYRHRNNYDPFTVTISVSARNNYVISYLDVTATVDALGDIEFNMIRGDAGSTTMVFQLVSNNSDFLDYSYMAYGITADEYRKMSNVTSFPIGKGWTDSASVLSVLLPFLLWIRNIVI